MVSKLTAVEITQAMKIGSGLDLAKQKKLEPKSTNAISTVPIQTKGPVRIATRGASDLKEAAEKYLKEEFASLGIDPGSEVIEGLAHIVIQAV